MDIAWPGLREDRAERKRAFSEARRAMFATRVVRMYEHLSKEDWDLATEEWKRTLELWKVSMRPTKPPATWRQDAERLMLEPPSPERELEVAHLLAAALEPVRNRFDIRWFGLKITKNRRQFGYCHRVREEHLPGKIRVRCSHPQDASVWLAIDSIILTLIHEMAHTKHRGHKAQFWVLVREMVDAAAEMGIYDPSCPRPQDTACGDAKLTGSAAHGRAEIARGWRRLWRAYRATDNPEGEATSQSWAAGEKAALTHVFFPSNQHKLGITLTVTGHQRFLVELHSDSGELFVALPHHLRRLG